MLRITAHECTTHYQSSGLETGVAWQRRYSVSDPAQENLYQSSGLDTGVAWQRRYSVSDPAQENLSSITGHCGHHRPGQPCLACWRSRVAPAQCSSTAPNRPAEHWTEARCAEGWGSRQPQALPATPLGAGRTTPTPRRCPARWRSRPLRARRRLQLPGMRCARAAAACCHCCPCCPAPRAPPGRPRGPVQEPPQSAFSARPKLFPVIACFASASAAACS